MAEMIKALHNIDKATLAAVRDFTQEQPRRGELDVLLFQTIASKQPINPYLTMTAGTVGSLLSTLLTGPQQFGREFVERFSPSAIEDVVKAEDRLPLFGDRVATACWLKYKQDLWQQIATPVLVEKWVKNSFVRSVTVKQNPGASR